VARGGYDLKVGKITLDEALAARIALNKERMNEVRVLGTSGLTEWERAIIAEQAAKAEKTGSK